MFIRREDYEALLAENRKLKQSLATYRNDPARAVELAGYWDKPFTEMAVKLAQAQQEIANLTMRLKQYESNIDSPYRDEKGRIRSASGRSKEENEDLALRMYRDGYSWEAIAEKVNLGTMKSVETYISRAKKREAEKADPRNKEVEVQKTTYSPTSGWHTERKMVKESDMDGDELRKDTRWRRSK